MKNLFNFNMTRKKWEFLSFYAILWTVIWSVAFITNNTTLYIVDSVLFTLVVISMYIELKRDE